MATNVALEAKVDPAVLLNMVQSESKWNPDAVGDHGCSFGLVQINTCANEDVSKEEALDPEFSLTYAAKAISRGDEWLWTSCNCYSYVSIRKNLPKMVQIVPNTTHPHVGDVAIFNYRGVKHIAYIVGTKNGITVVEANKTHCKTGTRTISPSDPYITGFWTS